MARVYVSVCMPAYNAAKYISEAIESVLAQQYNNFELLICDDCSGDNTWKIISRYRNNTKVRILRNRKNLGVGATRNKLLKLARGKYITPCDADDIMLPGNLKRLSGYLDGNCKYAAVYADVLITETRSSRRLGLYPYINKIDKYFQWDILQNLANHSGSMMRLGALRRVGGYNKELYSIDDWDLWLKLAEIGKIKYLQGEFYYVWRRNQKSLTRTEFQIKESYHRIISAAIKRRYGLNINFSQTNEEKTD